MLNETELNKNKRYKITYSIIDTGETGTYIAKGSDFLIGHDSFNAVKRGDEMAEYLGVIAELNAIARKMYDLSYKNDVEMLRPYALLLDEIGTILFREIC